MKNNSDLSTKPYTKCLTCPHRRVRCSGPRTAGLELASWCEYVRDMKEVNGLTNADVAERSGVSLKTIERLMTLKADQDIMRETARLIETAITGLTSKFPCYLDFEKETTPDVQKLSAAMSDLEHALADNRDYKAVLDNIHTSYNAEMQTIREEAQKEIQYLLDQVARLRGEIDYLRLENDRKAKIIDKFLEK